MFLKLSRKAARTLNSYKVIGSTRLIRQGTRPIQVTRARPSFHDAISTVILIYSVIELGPYEDARNPFRGIEELKAEKRSRSTPCTTGDVSYRERRRLETDDV